MRGEVAKRLAHHLYKYLAAREVVISQPLILLRQKRDDDVVNIFLVQPVSVTGDVLVRFPVSEVILSGGEYLPCLSALTLQVKLTLDQIAAGAAAAAPFRNRCDPNKNCHVYLVSFELSKASTVKTGRALWRSFRVAGVEVRESCWTAKADQL